MFWRLCIVLIATSLWANDAATIVTENDPSTLVNGVSVITGDFYFGEEDYTVAGAEPVPIRRFYLSSFGKIDQYQHLTAEFFQMMANFVAVNEPNGTSICYRADSTNYKRGYIGDNFYQKRTRPLKYHSEEFSRTSLGVTNTSTGTISAKSHLKNQTVIFHPGSDPKGKSFTLYAADGTVRRYTNSQGQEKTDFEVIDSGYPIFCYHLISETLPNGRIVHYEWDDKNHLMGIRTSNPSNTKTLARASFPTVDIKHPGATYSISGSDGRRLSYIARKTGKKDFELACVASPERADQTFQYDAKRISRISLPNGQTTVIEYNNGRVSKLLLPMGPSGSLVPFCSFNYTSQNKTSDCIDALGHRTVYCWNDDFRLTRIERWNRQQERKNSERFVWDGTNLQCRVFYNEDGTPLFAKTLIYDDRGNVLKETLWGNLSGRSAPLHLDDHGMPLDDGVEKAVTINCYESRNLLVRREEPSGLVTEYSYLDRAQLPSCKTLSMHGRVYSTTTYTYDDDNTLIREVAEDGSHVRKIQEIVPRQTEPYIGLPDLIIEKYQEQGSGRLLRKTKLHYTTGARIAQKDIFDADGVVRYSLSYQYDEKGHLLRETNAIGQTAVSSYDEAGNRIYLQDASGRVETFFDYDPAGRLIKKTETGCDGIEQNFSYSYDRKHNLIAQTDPFGNTICYEYDLSNKPIQTTFPVQLTKNGGSTRPTIRTQYDSMGNPILRIDAEGHETRTCYNILGKPIRITHPDGAVEEYIYNLDGSLAVFIDAAGVKTYYQYDAFGHLLEKKTGDAEESFVYDGSRLIEKTDAEGTKTIYRYDGAGRKIAEETAGEVVAFSYDPLGRLFCRSEGDLVTQYQYDLLDRLLEERKCSCLGDLLQITQYEYDAAGNETAVIRGYQSVQRYEFDSLNRMICKTDSLGAVETIQYEIVQNSLGQKVLRQTATDPLGLQTITIFDAQHRATSVEKRKNGPLLVETMFYNQNGSKTYQQEQIYDPEGFVRAVCNEWIYDSCDRLIALVEGNGAKTTKYEYNLCGDKTAAIKPNGVRLTYEYNDLGHLVHLFSSDGSVDHHLEVDRLGRPTHFDGIARKLDAQGRILEEAFPNGPVIVNQYDLRGRKTSCCIPLFDIEIQYQHTPLDVAHVCFRNYTHSYKYDLLGNPIRENLIGQQGVLDRSYDLDQRPLAMQSGWFSQCIEEYDAVGNVLRMTINGASQVYNYDALYQLTQESGTFCHRYAFDGLYNRLSKDAESYTLNALNQTISHGTYDDNGNPIQIGSMKLFYDALDRLIRVETPDSTQTFTYDYLNRCIHQTVSTTSPYWYFSQTVSTVSTGFLYDGQREIGSFDDQLKDFRVLGRTKTAEIGSAVAIMLDQSLYVPIHDLQGNIAAMMPFDQKPASYYRYSAFGEEMREGSIVSPWRFSSKRVDALTGFVNYGRRFYMPSLGRWLTPDPAGFTDGMNLYAFVHNDPLTHFDEYGLIMTGYDWKSFQSMSSYNPQSSWCVSEIGRSLASQMTHGIYDLSGLGFIRKYDRSFPGWQPDNDYRDHLSIDRFFGTQFTQGKALRESFGIRFSEGMLPYPSSVFSLANRVSGVSRGVFGIKSVPDFRLPRIINRGWVLPREGGGSFINGRWYTEHALERMAPRTPQVMAELENRFLERAKVASQNLHSKEFYKWRLENAPNPRGIPPSVVEAEIAQPGSTGVRVILNENGHVITIIPRG